MPRGVQRHELAIQAGSACGPSEVRAPGEDCCAVRRRCVAASALASARSSRERRDAQRARRRHDPVRSQSTLYSECGAPPRASRSARRTAPIAGSTSRRMRPARRRRQRQPAFELVVQPGNRLEHPAGEHEWERLAHQIEPPGDRERRRLELVGRAAKDPDRDRSRPCLERGVDALRQRAQSRTAADVP